MSGTAKRAGLAVVAVLAVVVTGGCGRANKPVVADAAHSVASTPTPTPSVTPTASVASPSDPRTMDLSDGVLKNKLYLAGKVPAVQCVLPRPNLTTKAGMLAYARVFVTCMDKAWAPVVERSDAYLVPPKIFAYSLHHLSATPECANPLANVDAFYRQGGLTGQICFDYDTFLGADDPVENLIDFEQLLAHEYGHHVQHSVGILTLYNELYRGRTQAGQLEVQRRKELQASCLGAAFLGANKSTFQLTGRRLAIWQNIVRHVGDEYNDAHIRDHGSRKSHAYWTLKAFTATTPAACNTFTAPPKRVS
ncbi:neutral zinc metallopeptidase [Kribbella sp. NBC_01484]|uniref:neutral zinc metallopeptidase n=1 Tax=Kribbella sp. NBC_01484 TaxID=2903579 RepID=UPI002E33BDBB|nr:neutral zinc metallopeptidase [Kribbella sp. NBC_01484]